MDYMIDVGRITDLVRRLDFPRVVGTDGEQRGYEIIRQELATMGIKAWFEEFPSPWIEIAEADLRVEEECWPITPLVTPLFNGQWLPISEEADIEGVLVDSLDLEADANRVILLRTSLDAATPCLPGFLAQVFACKPEVSFVAYYLAAVSSLGRPVPSAYVAPEVEHDLRKWIGRTCRLRWTSKKSQKTLRNLVAELRGTELPEEVIAIGAHIDSFPGTVGASDNASGCARLVEFARWFVAHPPLRTLRFIWFTGEELDRRGSRAYVQAHVDDGGRICLFINVDGGVSIEHQRPEVDIENFEAVAAVVSKACEAVYPGESSLPFRRVDHCPDGSDAESFHSAGIPAVFAPGGGKRKKTGPNPHLPTDTVARLDWKNVRTATVLALAFIDAAQKCGLATSSSQPRGCGT